MNKTKCAKCRGDEVRVIVIEPNGVPETRIVKRNLETFQGIVGGYIEMMTVVNNGIAMYINEEGRMNGMPLNTVASAIAHRLVFGPVVIFRSARGENEDSLTEDDIRAITE